MRYDMTQDSGTIGLQYLSVVDHLSPIDSWFFFLFGDKDAIVKEEEENEERGRKKTDNKERQRACPICGSVMAFSSALCLCVNLSSKCIVHGPWVS